jgi:transcriptional antiterminator RfaH
MAGYWAVARSEPGREATAVNFLGRGGYGTYLPRIREWRINHGRRVAVTPPLFPNYLFCRIEAGWWSARWCIGVAAMILSGDQPARVPDAVIAELQGRERDGYVELPEPPRLKPGDPIRVTAGALAGMVGLYAGLRGHERVAVLLGVLGTAVLPTGDVESTS